MSSAAELYTLPDGWLACDTCGRPVHHSKLDTHMASLACYHEQHSEPPHGWYEVVNHGVAGPYNVGDLLEIKAPVFTVRATDGTVYRAFTPPWVHIIAALGCSKMSRMNAIRKARSNHGYRAAILAGLRLVNASDIEAIQGILDLGDQYG